MMAWVHLGEVIYEYMYAWLPEEIITLFSFCTGGMGFRPSISTDCAARRFAGGWILPCVTVHAVCPFLQRRSQSTVMDFALHACMCSGGGGGVNCTHKETLAPYSRGVCEAVETGRY